MTPRFFYFDLGNVLLTFDHEIACRQAAALTGRGVDQMRQAIFESDLENRYERGDVTSREFFEIFCAQTDTRPDYDAFRRACSEIFEINAPVVPIVAQLRAAGHRLGILSNTCEAHWEYASTGRYRILRENFEIYALSYEMKAMKPDRSIYDEAARLAGVPPQDIFFVDDRADNVAGALAAGWDAVQYVTPCRLADDLHRRQVRMNY